MTRKHYNAIAAGFNRRLNSDLCIDKRVRIGVEQAAQDMAYLFAETEPNFNAMRFLDACGVER